MFSHFYQTAVPDLQGGWLQFPKKADLPPILARFSVFQQVRVLPRGSYYVIEVVYNKEEVDLGLSKWRVMGIDLGISNLVTAVCNVPIIAPFVIKEGAVKSINQFYNKRWVQLRSIAAKENFTPTTNRIQYLHWARSKKIADFFHKASCAIVNYCIGHDIGTIVVGYNPRWKQLCSLGRRTNQNFASLPFHTLIRQVQYKATLTGIEVILVDERYTSRCSFLDGELAERHEHYAGRRVQRGLYRASSGTLINTDVNAAYIILQKAVPNAFADGIEGTGLHPVLIGLA